METEFQEHTFDTGVVTINYAEFAPPAPLSAPSLVILYGGAGRWQYYQGVYPDLAAHYHLYAPDFRGHGKSGRVPARYRFQDYADDTIAFLRCCVAAPAYLFGHSLGGMVALMVAAQAPDRGQRCGVTWLGAGSRSPRSPRRSGTRLRSCPVRTNR